MGKKEESCVCMCAVCMYMWLNCTTIQRQVTRKENKIGDGRLSGTGVAVAYPERVLWVLEHPPRPKLQPLVNDNINTAWCWHKSPTFRIGPEANCTPPPPLFVSGLT